MNAVKRPPRLKPGDAVSVVAPSGPVPRESFEAGVARLAGRYALKYDERIFARQGFLAGSDDARLAELTQAFADPTTKAIFVARGGYGLLRILDRLSRPAIEKLVVGFSDVTALHGWLTHAGISSIHGPVLTQLGHLPADDFTAFIAALESTTPPMLTGLRSIAAKGSAEGPLRGGNLEVLSRLIGTDYQLDMAGTILLIEDVGERPYRVDRILTQLELSGALSHVAGILVGDFVRCVDTDGSAPSVDEVIVERLGRLKVPVLCGAPIGHGDRNRAVPLNLPVKLDAAAGTATFVASAGA